MGDSRKNGRENQLIVFLKRIDCRNTNDAWQKLYVSVGFPELLRQFYLISCYS
jgi:hypothetical protein